MGDSGSIRVRNAMWTAAALVVVVGGLREAQSLLVPVVISALMAVICWPAVRWLRDRRVPGAFAVLAVVALLFLIAGSMGALVGGSVRGFSDAIPGYQERLGIMTEHGFAAMRDWGIPLDAAAITSAIEPASSARRAMEFVGTSMNALTLALSNTVLVLLTMILILFEGDTISVKLRALTGGDEDGLGKFATIAHEIQSYLFIKTALSLGTGLLIFVWARILGVDFALLWGLIALLLNYVPNIGSVVAAIPAMLLAFVQIGPGSALLLGAGYVVVNMVVGNVIEPLWMGHRLGLSTTVVFLSLVVWGWIWGPTGMLLSVPLTMVIKILAESSEDYKIIATLLSDSPKGDDGPPSLIDRVRRLSGAPEPTTDSPPPRSKKRPRTDAPPRSES